MLTTKKRLKCALTGFWQGERALVHLHSRTAPIQIACMHLPLAALSFLAAISLTIQTRADDVPAKPLAEKGKLVFSDDFSSDRFGAEWKAMIPSAGVENGVMYGRQTTTQHGSVALAKLDLPDGNLICECRVQFEHNVTVAFSFDDMKYKGSVAGHIARVTLEQQLVKLHDDKEGSMNNKLIAARKGDDAQKKSEAEAAVKLHTLEVPMKLETTHWYTIGIEIAGDRMRLTIDGKPIGLLKSAGLTHSTKSDFKLSVSGKQALLDDLRIWSVAAP